MAARVAAPLLTAGALAALAVLTVEHAGCDDPARYVTVPGGYALVGGCLSPEDLLVPVPGQPAGPANPVLPSPPARS